MANGDNQVIPLDPDIEEQAPGIPTLPSTRAFTIQESKRKLIADISKSEGRRPEGVVVLKSFLKEQGADLVGIDEESGALQVVSEKGKKGRISPEKLMQLFQARGIDTRNKAIITNTPEDPIQQSPLSLTDRVKVKALGNTKGSLNFLKQRFDDVAWDDKQGFVVRKGNSFFALDPDFLGTGNAWEKTQELVKDAADLTDFGLDIVFTSFGQRVGAAAGAAAAGGVGPQAVAGAATGGLAGIAAGQAASTGVRTSLGRLVGTYDATPEEQVSDMAFEGVLAFGGAKYLPPALAGGARLSSRAAAKAETLIAPTVQSVKNAYKRIQQGTSRRVKELLAEYLRRTGSTGEVSHLHAIERADQVFGIIDRQIARAPTKLGQQHIDDIASRAKAPLKTLIENVEPTVKLEFRKREKQFLALAPNKLPAQNIKNLVQESMTEFMRLGAVTAKKITTSPQTQKEILEFGSFLPKDIEGLVAIRADEFQPLALKDFQALVEKQGLSPLVAKKAHTQLKKLVTFANSLLNKKGGVVETKNVLQMRRMLDDFVFNIAKDKQTRQALAPATKPLRRGLVNFLETQNQPAVTQAYREMNEFWIRNQDVLEEAERALSTASSFNSFSNQLLGAAGKNTPQRELVRRMADMQGEAGKALLNGFMDHEAAAHYIRSYPNIVGTSGGLSAAIKFFLPGGTPRRQKALLKWIGRGAPLKDQHPLMVEAAQEQTILLRNTLLGMSGEQLESLLANDQAMATLMGTISANVASEVRGKVQAREMLKRGQ